MSRTLTVSQLLNGLRSSLQRDRNLQNVVLRGELSNLIRSAAGHVYFVLKDSRAQVHCVMFGTSARNLRFHPEDGLQVLVAGEVDVYLPQGKLQVRVRAMRPDGLGALYEALERVKATLAAEGLFDSRRKRPLPFLPRRIGLVTSLEGAVLHDVFTTLRRRNAAVEVFLAPATVQGPDAPRQLIRALQALQQVPGTDLIIIARGGGSLEDLMAFNSEPLVRAVVDCRIPVISAVGHETDTTLCDLAADQRAATPTAAAEMAAPPGAELKAALGELGERLRRALTARAERERLQLERLSGSPALRYPERIMEREAQLLDELKHRLAQALVARVRGQRQQLDGLMRSPALRFPTLPYRAEQERLAGLQTRLRRGFSLQLESRRRDVDSTAAQLRSLSPQRVLERGYAICLDPAGRPIQRVQGRSRGDSMEVRLVDGSLQATVEAVEFRGDGSSPWPT